MPTNRLYLLVVPLLAGLGACSDDGEGPGTVTKTCQARCTNASTDCPGTMPLCVNGKCVACEKDGDCSTGTRCNTQTGTCNYCEANADCNASLYVGCNTTAKICVHCKQDTDCATSGGGKAGTGKCDVPTGQCVGCSSDSDCVGQAYEYCKNGACSIQCKSDADCTATLGSTGWCDTASGLCIGCETAAECDDAFDIQVVGKHLCL